MNLRFFEKIATLTLMAIFLLVFFKTFAQDSTIQRDLENICESEEEIEKECENLSLKECRELLEQCVQYLDEKSGKISQDISKTQKEQATLKNQISVLTKKITQLATQIQQGNIMIRDLSLQIKDSEISIEKTSQKIETKKKQLAIILRTIYEMDKKSLIEILLTEKTLSGFFDNLTYLETLNSKTQELLEAVKNLKITLEDQKLILDKEKENLENVVRIQTIQKQESEKTKKEKEQLSKLTEAQYQKLLKEKKEIEQKAAAIRAKIFELVGVERAPTFGEAIEVAKVVTNIINIRPAFLLAIISEESAIGRNVGQCYLQDFTTGMGVKITTGRKWPRTMRPHDNIPIFLEITKKFDFNPTNTPVSCWIPICATKNSKGVLVFDYTPSVDSEGKITCSKSGYVPYGWGGAMGPAQFMPSTWNLYESKISEKLGGKIPNPWAIYDSFLAAAIYLADLGATAKTRQSEITAANKYCGGYSWYAKQVMEKADCIQTFIDTNTMSSYCQDLIGLR